MCLFVYDLKTPPSFYNIATFIAMWIGNVIYYT